MTVEHRVLKRDDPQRAGDYENCLYACRLCNSARGTKDLVTAEARLLDPCEDPWAAHFEAQEDALQPKHGDVDAHYTYKAYDLDSESKTSRRRARRELIGDRLKLVAQLEDELAALLELADPVRETDFETFSELWREISDLRQQAHRAVGDLRLYRAVPRDAPEDCRCSERRELALPTSISAQCVEVTVGRSA